MPDTSLGIFIAAILLLLYVICINTKNIDGMWISVDGTVYSIKRQNLVFAIITKEGDADKANAINGFVFMGMIINTSTNTTNSADDAGLFGIILKNKIEWFNGSRWTKRS